MRGLLRGFSIAMAWGPEEAGRRRGKLQGQLATRLYFLIRNLGE